jgi:hypothetical protein
MTTLTNGEPTAASGAPIAKMSAEATNYAAMVLAIDTPLPVRDRR